MHARTLRVRVQCRPLRPGSNPNPSALLRLVPEGGARAQEHGLLPLAPLAPLALLSGVIGSYAGCFFRRRGDDRSFDAGRLLAQEGAGMAAGIALAAAGIATAGPGFILAGPLAPALLCAATLPRAVRVGDGSDSKI